MTLLLEHFILNIEYGCFHEKDDFCSQIKFLSMKMNKLFLCLFILLFFSCSEKKQKDDFIRTVKIVAPEIQSEKSTKFFSGVVKESKEIDLGFRTAGKIGRIMVKEGEFVNTGDVIATLEQNDYALAVEALQIQYNQLKDEVSRMKVLYDQKGISGNDYEKAVAGLKQLGIQLQSSKNNLEYTYLKSPIDGYIKDVKFEVAEMVNTGTPVFTIVENGKKRVEFDIPASLYVDMDSIDGISCVGNNGISSDIKIVSISPKADNNQMFKVQADIVLDSADAFIPGMNVNVAMNLLCRSDVNGWLLPFQSVFEDSGTSCVWKVTEGDIIHKSVVKILGLSEDGHYIVSGDFNSDDRIVAAGVNSLSDGDKVNVIGTVSETNVGGLL